MIISAWHRRRHAGRGGPLAAARMAPREGHKSRRAGRARERLSRVRRRGARSAATATPPAAGGRPPCAARGAATCCAPARPRNTTKELDTIAVGDQQQLPAASRALAVKPLIATAACTSLSHAAVSGCKAKARKTSVEHIARHKQAVEAELGGCGILGVGIWLAVTQGNFATLSSSFPSLSAANLLIVTGTFVMIIGFVGCIGAIKENKCLLLSIDKYAQRDLKKGLHLYGTDGNIGLTNAWSIIQTDFRCCGVSNYTDWFEVYNTTRVPDSCCLEFSENCGLHSPGTWWKAPCYETVKIWLQENLLAVGIFGLCTALVQHHLSAETVSPCVCIFDCTMETMPLAASWKYTRRWQATNERPQQHHSL
ncbi:tetraspanin-4 isoform X3 [Cygnus olor]|uniref:tetraspanin-4 isoform X3 n=1 Tax=Cygnus olor TaxID=8869 RepID=UPI001ADE173E|nr:tetraspanin-4 isoform X3 [Cygnus olor]